MVRFAFLMILMFSSATAFAMTKADSLTALGEEQMATGLFEAAVETFGQLAKAKPEDVEVQTRLGYAYLKAKNYEAAEKAFKAAKKLDKTFVPAYVGLGMTYVEGPAKGLEAVYHFRRAVGEAKRSTKLDPDYAPAYRLLSELYERFREDREKAITYYLQYLKLEPDNPEGLYSFGRVCIQAGQYDKIERYIIPYLETHPDAIQLLPLTAQSYFFLEHYQAALEHFERYLQHRDEAERAHYTDISLVASGKERKAYQALSDEGESQAYLKGFWRRRDPDILTGINERIIEHYRRVWYARTFFSKYEQPWDQRGEVYIRYGEPDHRARSIERQVRVSPEVEAVRTQMAVDMYGPEAAYLTFSGPVFPVKVQRDPYSTSVTFNAPDELLEATLARPGGEAPASNLDGEDDVLVTQAEQGGLGSLEAQIFQDVPGESEFVNQRNEAWRVNPRFGFEDYAPVTLDSELQAVPWEAWTYTQLGRGVEFTFTDELSSGRFEFAPMPTTPTGERVISKIGRLTEYAPAVMFERVQNKTPDYYRPGIGKAPLHFFYDLAAFRGPGEQTTLEVYYGVPPGEVKIEQAEEQDYIRVQAALALADAGHTHIYREAEVFLYERSRNEGFSRAKGVFVPDVLTLNIPPGKYELQVQLKDMNSGRVGLYKQAVDVRDYAQETLQISDIELAYDIGEKPSNIRFLKEDIWVVPMPSRAYAGSQKVYVYFEIYNLKQNPFGQTRYKVQYLIRYNPRAISGILGSVATGLSAFIKYRKPQVSVSYEQVGTDTRTREYVELDLQKVKRGVNVLEIQITDLVSGEQTSRAVSFQYGKQSEEDKQKIARE